MSMLENTHLNPISVTIGDTERTFSVNSHTEYGEPQIWIDFSDGTGLEITHKTFGLKEKDWYYTMRHLTERNNPEKYDAALASFVYGDYNDLCRGLSIFLNNKYSILNRKNILA